MAHCLQSFDSVIRCQERYPAFYKIFLRFMHFMLNVYCVEIQQSGYTGLAWVWLFVFKRKIRKQSGILYLHTSFLLIISLHLSAILNHTFSSQLSLPSHPAPAPPIRSLRHWRSINLVVCMYVCMYVCSIVWRQHVCRISYVILFIIFVVSSLNCFVSRICHLIRKPSHATLLTSL